MRSSPIHFTKASPAALVLGVWIGCGGVRTARDDLVVLIENPVRTLDPRFALGSYDSKVGHLVAPGLVSVDTPDSSPVPLLAESIEREGPGRYLVTIREQARFPSGRAVSARDVVYTFESILDPALHSSYARSFADKGFSAHALTIVGPRQVRFVLPRPLASFLSDLDFGILDEQAALAAGQGGRFVNGQAVGAGPFRVISRSDERVELAPNPFWLGGPSKLRRLVFRVIRDDGSRLLALVGGSADLLQNSAAPPPPLLETVLGRGGMKALSAQSAVWTYLGINCEDPLLRDVRVRRAIALAIDRKGLIARKLYGRAVLSTGMLPPSHWAHAKEAPAVPFDPARARALLVQAGALGAHLVFKMSAASKFRLAIARVIAQQLADVGFEVEVHAYEFGTFFSDVKRGNYQIFMLQLPEVTEPDYYYSFFHSSRIPEHDNPDAGNNRWRFRDAQIDAWVQAGQRTEDLQERRRLYALVQRRLAELVPVVPLWHEDNIAVMRQEVQGYSLWPNARFSSLATVWKQR